MPGVVCVCVPQCLEGVDQDWLVPNPFRVVLDHGPGQLDGHKLDLDPVDLGQVGRVVGSGHGVGQHRTGLRPYSRPLVTQFFSLTAFLKSNISVKACVFHKRKIKVCLTTMSGTQIENITCGSMGDAKSIAMKCFGFGLMSMKQCSLLWPF